MKKIKINNKLSWKRGGGYGNLIALIIGVGLAFIVALVFTVSALQPSTTAKERSLAPQLQGMQAAVDLFYNDQGYYPTGYGNQPSVTGAVAAAICIAPGENGISTTDYATICASSSDASKTFLQAYGSNTLPVFTAADYALSPTGGTPTPATSLYYGITGYGVVFVTQTPPTVTTSAATWTETATAGASSIPIVTIQSAGSAAGNSGWPTATPVNGSAVEYTPLLTSD